LSNQKDILILHQPIELTRGLKNCSMNEHKHLANTLIEIPKETIQQWNLEAQKYSMEHYNRVESAVVELYMKLKTDTFRIIERNKNSQAELVENYTITIGLQEKLIIALKTQVEQLKMQIKKITI